MITAANYHSPENTAISNSKVGDFLLSKEYYKRKHIDHSIIEEPTDAMKKGLIVDALFCDQPVPYIVKVLKKDDPETYAEQQAIPPELLVSASVMEEAEARAFAIMREPFYQWYKQNGTQFQVCLSGSTRMGHDLVPVCGLADAITETPTCVYIDDGKSTTGSKVRSATHWFWNCKDMGYLRQLSVYKRLWKQMHPRDKRTIRTRHFCVYDARNGIFKVKLFEIPTRLLEEPWKEFEKTVRAIRREKEWFDKPVTWSNVERLENPLQPDVIEDDSL